MDDLSTPSPWQATRFEVRTRLEPLDYLHSMSAVRWSVIERVVAWLAAVGMSGIGAVAALILLEPFVERLPVYPYWDWGLAIALAGALVAFLVYKVFIMGPYIDSMFQGQPIGMGEIDDRRRRERRDRDVGRHRDPHPVGEDPGRGRHQPAPVPDVRPAGRRHRSAPRVSPNDGEAQRFAEFVRSKTAKPN